MLHSYPAICAGEVSELVEGAGLENQCAATYRGFESHPLRHSKSNDPQGYMVWNIDGRIRTHISEVGSYASLQASKRQGRSPQTTRRAKAGDGQPE